MKAIFIALIYVQLLFCIINAQNTTDTPSPTSPVTSPNVITTKPPTTNPNATTTNPNATTLNCNVTIDPANVDILVKLKRCPVSFTEVENFTSTVATVYRVRQSRIVTNQNCSASTQFVVKIFGDNGVSVMKTLNEDLNNGNFVSPFIRSSKIIIPSPPPGCSKKKKDYYKVAIGVAIGVTLAIILLVVLGIYLAHKQIMGKDY